MTESWVDIPASGGRMAGFLARPGKPAPGLVMLQEVFGVNPAMQDKARTFAKLGFAVVVPDLFWRLEPRVSLGYAGEERAKAFELFGKFDFAAGIRDIAAAARWLEQSASPGGKVGVIGFCLGGRLAVAATAAYPFAAVASLYGVKLEADPQRLKAIDVPLQIHVGDKDAHVPAESLDKIKEIVGRKPNVRVFIYPGAQHGFFNAARAEVYAPQAANVAQERVAKMFSDALELRVPLR